MRECRRTVGTDLCGMGQLFNRKTADVHGGAEEPFG
jgi:hypothetical protein